MNINIDITYEMFLQAEDRNIEMLNQYYYLDENHIKIFLLL